MKKTLLMMATSLIFSGNLFSTEINIYPTVQEIDYLENQQITLSKGTPNLIGANLADSYAVALLKNLIGDYKINIVIGEKNDKGMDKYTKVPNISGGYYLKIDKTGIVIIGNDEIGTFYGVQTLSQLLTNVMKTKKVLPFVEIVDFPTVPFRGTVEGFYGKPWSHEDRKSQIKFYGKYKLNAYIYGPKDDPFHGFSNRWREPYPADKAEQMKELVTIAKENKVNFIWAIHPGVHISWKDNDGDGIIDDFVACLKKFEMMYDLGIRSFAVFFDDIGGEGTNPERQAEMLNYLNREFVRKKGDVTPLVMCPTQYNKAWSGGNYLDILGTKMDGDINIMWTGNSVCADITAESMDWINKRIKRKAYIWWNWPVSDYCRTQLLLGRTYGLDKDNGPKYSGFVSNPMDKPEASKIALFGVADYAWNPKQFDSDKSWKHGIKLLYPTCAEEMQLFANHNSDQGQNYHGYRREESAEIKPYIDAALKEYRETSKVTNQEVIKKLLPEFGKMSKYAKVLKTEIPKINPNLSEEIEYWLETFDLLGAKGHAVTTLLTESRSIQDQLCLVSRILDYDKKMEIISEKQRIKGAPDRYAKGCATGSRVIVPFLNEIFEKESAKLYKEITGKSASSSAIAMFKAFSNVPALKNVTAERKDVYVNIQKILEVITLEAGQYVGLELPEGIFANYVHLKLDNPNASKQGIIELSKDGINWTKLNSDNKGQEMEKRLNVNDKIRFMRYKNVSAKPIEIKLNQFKLDIPKDAQANSRETMFDGNFKTSFVIGKRQKIVIPNDFNKEATKVYLVGDTEKATIKITLVDGKTTSMLIDDNNKVAIKELIIETDAEAIKINEIIFAK